MLQDPNVERIIENRLKPLQDEINLLKTELIKIKNVVIDDDDLEPKICPCGEVPYTDRIMAYPYMKWVACNCGRVGRGHVDWWMAIVNWNEDKIQNHD